MSTSMPRRAVLASSVVVLFSFCSSALASDPKVGSTWQVPQHLSFDSVFSASLKALSGGDLEIVSHDRQSGVITAKKSIPVLFSRIPSQVPFTVSISKANDQLTLNTVAYLKGMGTASAHETLLQNFYDALFLELKVSRPEERSVSRS